MKSYMSIIKKRKQIKTSEDFYPTFYDRTVNVSIIHDGGKGPNRWRVCIGGDDDFGMELLGLEITAAFDMFNSIKDGITQKQLCKLGFVGA